MYEDGIAAAIFQGDLALLDSCYDRLYAGRRHMPGFVSREQWKECVMTIRFGDKFGELMASVKAHDANALESRTRVVEPLDKNWHDLAHCEAGCPRHGVDTPAESVADYLEDADRVKLITRGRSVNIHTEGVLLETCFAFACRVAGVVVNSASTSVCNLDRAAIQTLSANREYKVAFVSYGLDDKRNHIDLVANDTPSSVSRIRPLTKLPDHDRVHVCTSMQHFFNAGSEWFKHRFYAQSDSFGAGVPDNMAGPTGFHPPAPASVINETAFGGGSNVSSGVTRAKKRTIAARSSALSGPVQKSYRTSNALLFNNADEFFQDKVSRELAQEIIEELFEVWGVPLDQPDSVKYAEDMLWTFLIAVTASNKADYNRVYDIPVKPIERNGDLVSVVDADFSKLSLLLESKFGVTRRQFARGLADDLRAFLKLEENQALLPPLATRVGCESLMAYLAFDGSTHCTNMTTREVTFTKTLESRNLFERDDEAAQGASRELMQGMSGGVRSKSVR